MTMTTTTTTETLCPGGNRAHRRPPHYDPTVREFHRRDRRKYWTGRHRLST